MKFWPKQSWGCCTVLFPWACGANCCNSGRGALTEETTESHLGRCRKEADLLLFLPVTSFPVVFACSSWCKILWTHRRESTWSQANAPGCCKQISTWTKRTECKSHSFQKEQKFLLGKKSLESWGVETIPKLQWEQFGVPVAKENIFLVRIIYKSGRVWGGGGMGTAHRRRKLD